MRNIERAGTALGAGDVWLRLARPLHMLAIEPTRFGEVCLTRLSELILP